MDRVWYVPVNGQGVVRTCEWTGCGTIQLEGRVNKRILVKLHLALVTEVWRVFVVDGRNLYVGMVKGESTGEQRLILTAHLC